MKKITFRQNSLILLVLCFSLLSLTCTASTTFFFKGLHNKSIATSYSTYSIDTVVIDLIGPQTIYIEACKPYYDPGAKVTSPKDTCNSCFVGDSSNVNTNIPGKYHIKFYIKSGMGFWGLPVTRTVIVKAKAPTIILNGNDTFYLAVFNKFIDPGIIAIDSCIGIKETLRIDSIDTSKIGSYTIHYYATNNAGLTTSAKRVVFVVDTIAPVINLIGDIIYKIDMMYELYYEQGWEVKDNYDSNINVDRSGTYFTGYLIDSNEGYYYIDYNASDQSGNKANTVRRYIQVEWYFSIKINQNPYIKIKLFPNPTQGKIYLDVQSPELNGVEVTVINMEGRIIRDIGKVCYPNQKYTINLDGLTDGIYLVKIRTATLVETIRFSLFR